MKQNIDVKPGSSNQGQSVYHLSLPPSRPALPSDHQTQIFPGIIE